MNQEMPTFDVTSIPSEFNPLVNQTLDGLMQQNQYAGDDKLFIQFKVEPVLNPSESTKQGRPIYDEVDMVVIRTPGSQLTSVIAPMKGEYMQRFGAKYREWKANRSATISGTPLESFPFLLNKVGLVAELKAMNVHTVEQLATLPDVAKQRVMGGFELCKRAAEWIDSTTGTDAKVAKLAQENEQLLARLTALETAASQAKTAKVPTKE